MALGFNRAVHLGRPGSPIPQSQSKELKAKGGMTRVIPLRTVWNDNLAPAYKAEHRSFEAWLGVLAKDNSAFSPPKHLNKGSTIPGEYATAWWAPRGEQRGNTMAELVVELALKASTYEGGCVRATIGPDAAKMVGFKKPTALDGIFFDEWVPSPSSPWGITGGGSLEAIAPKITLSQTTELEFLPGDMSKAEDSSQVVKDRALELVSAKQPFKSVEDLHATLAEAKNLLESEGLKSLEAKPTSKSGFYDIIAIASPPKSKRIEVEETNRFKAVRVGSTIRGNFTHFVWDDFPSHSITKHPVNSKYGHVTATSASKLQPRGEYTVPNPRNPTPDSADKWRRMIFEEYDDRKAELEENDPSTSYTSKYIESLLAQKYKMSWEDLILRDWEAHHIHPCDWGGGTAKSNFIYLKENDNGGGSPPNQHSPLTTWWKKMKGIIQTEVK